MGVSSNRPYSIVEPPLIWFSFDRHLGGAFLNAEPVHPGVPLLSRARADQCRWINKFDLRWAQPSRIPTRPFETVFLCSLADEKSRSTGKTEISRPGDDSNRGGTRPKGPRCFPRSRTMRAAVIGFLTPGSIQITISI